MDTLFVYTVKSSTFWECLGWKPLEKPRRSVPPWRRPE